MRSNLLARRIMAPALGLALAATVAACSSSSSSSAAAPPSTSAPASSSAPSSSAPSAPASSASASTGGNSAAIGQIKANWEAFFSGHTSAEKKISLLQNGQKYAAVIRAQANSQLASSVSAKVTAVVVNSATSATVSYNIAAGGQTLLPNQTGTAVNEGGVWKVGDVSFCQLLKLQGNAPAICNAS